MFRTAALLIVVALASSPIEKAVCDLWCLTGEDTGAMNHAACHDADDGNGPRVTALPEFCGRMIVAGVFVPERVHRPNGSLVVAVATVTAAPLLAAPPVPRAMVTRGEPDRPRAGTPRPLRI